MANPWDNDAVVGRAPVVVAPSNPNAGNQERRAERAAELEAQRLELARQQAALSQQSEARQSGAQQFQQGNAGFDNQAKLRTEFNALPAVKDYRESFTQLMAALKAAPNGTGDNALIYAYAKVMDPGSVVRESEMAMAGSGDSSVNAIGARLKKQFGIEGGGNLSEKVRRDLKLAINTKVAQFAKAYGESRQWYQEQAKANGFDPDQVVGPAPAQPFVKEYERLIGGLTGENQPKDKAVPGIATGGNYSTPEDRRIAGLINGAFSRGASFDDLQAMAKDAGIELGPEHRANVERRDKGLPVNEFLPAESGQTTGLMSAIGDFAQTPTGTALASSANAGLAGIPQLIAGDEPFEALRAMNPKAAFAGDVMGGVAGTAGMAGGLMKAGLAAPRAATAANLGFGTLFGANTNEDDRLKGAGIGAGASLVGDLAGKYALAPLATKAIDSSPVQAGINRVRGMFGRAPAVVPRPIQVGEAAVGDEAAPRIDDIMTRLREASSLNLPFSLADADPALRQQLGSAARLSPEVQSSVGGQLSERSLGQADRALTGVSRSLAPPVSMSDTAATIRQSARQAADPLYREAFAMPAPSSPAIDEILNTPSGQKAARSAYDIAMDRGKSPAELAMALNPDGTARLDASPTYETLDFVKKGFDQTLAPYRNPNSGRLDLEGNPLAQGIDQMRKSFLSELDAGNPVYAQARSTYADAIKPRTSLESGYRAAQPSVTQDEFGQMIGGLSAPETGTFRQGYSTSMSDRINKTRMSANPYDIVAGTPDQQAKLRALYPDADAFLRQRALEQDMAKTAQEVLGGSQTQGRALADQRFTGAGMGAGDVAEIGLSAVTGMPPVGVATRAVSGPLRGMFGRRSEAKAAERAKAAAPLLFNPDAEASARALQALIDDITARRGYEALIKAGSGVVGGGLLGGGSASY